MKLEVSQQICVTTNKTPARCTFAYRYKKDTG